MCSGTFLMVIIWPFMVLAPADGGADGVGKGQSSPPRPAIQLRHGCREGGQRRNLRRHLVARDGVRLGREPAALAADNGIYLQRLARRPGGGLGDVPSDCDVTGGTTG